MNMDGLHEIELVHIAKNRITEVWASSSRWLSGNKKIEININCYFSRWRMNNIKSNGLLKPTYWTSDGNQNVIEGEFLVVTANNKPQVNGKCVFLNMSRFFSEKSVCWIILSLYGLNCPATHLETWHRHPLVLYLNSQMVCLDIIKHLLIQQMLNCRNSLLWLADCTIPINFIC